jgi:NAD(P)-dependent dehydrogenase (short-subunit alcohol dehydrogenase family)
MKSREAGMKNRHWALAGVGTAALAWLAYSRLKRDDLRGKSVLIMGGSRGLGLALAEQFAREGCRIALCARDPDELRRAREQVAALGTEAFALRCDVRRREEVEDAVARVERTFGGVDVLVNVAGIISVGPLESQRLEDFEEAMDVMFWGPVHASLAALPGMARRGTGRIVNISSIGGKVAVPHLLPYTCAKFAVVGFSEGLRTEAKRLGVRVLTVAPGLMRTGSHLNAVFKGRPEVEYGLFSVGATLPGISISAGRAARQIVNATKAGQAELIITWQAELASAFHGLFPGLTSDLLSLVARALPSGGDGSPEARTGRESETAFTRSALTALGREAARRYNQLG